MLNGNFDFKENDFKNKSNIGSIIISTGDSCNLIKDTIGDEKYEELLNILNAKEYKI